LCFSPPRLFCSRGASHHPGSCLERRRFGARAGVVGGLLLGAPVQGALIGGAVGAALTKSSDIDLGKPVWNR
jgi:hypothetical protein